MKTFLAAMVLAAMLPGAALACGNDVACLRELVARLVSERARAEIETAQEMVRLKRALEQTINERDAARAKLRESAK